MENNFIEQLNSYSKEVLIKFIEYKFSYNRESTIKFLNDIKDNLAFKRKMQNEDQAWNDYQKASDEYIHFIKQLQNKYDKQSIKITELTSKEAVELSKLYDNQKRAFDKWTRCNKLL